MYMCVHVHVHVGGHDGLSIFNTVERFDPYGQLWTMVTPMHNRRCRVGVTATCEKLYRCINVLEFFFI